MKPGDILLIKFRFDLVGLLIRRATKSDFNHVALAVSDTHIIEGRGRGVIIVPSTRYLWNSMYKTKLIRIRNLNKDKIKKVVNYAKTQVGKSNYLKWIICILMLACGNRKPMKRKTCSGFIADCFEQIDIKFRGDKLSHEITPADIANYNKAENVSNEM